MRHVVVRLPAPVGQLHPLSRFLADFYYLREPNAKLLVGWLREPYSA
jgi:hypothetical protein